MYISTHISHPHFSSAHRGGDIAGDGFRDRSQRLHQERLHKELHRFRLLQIRTEHRLV